MISTQIDRLQEHFNSGLTLSLESRLKLLKLLEENLNKFESQIIEALYQDLKKPSFEAFTSEIAIVKEELKATIANLPNWASEQTVSTPVLFATSISKILPQPKGLVLIIGPWNYPFNLLFAPLVSAIAAGNVCVVKPSELAPATAKVIAALVKETFPAENVVCIQGDVTVSQELLARPWDHVFFTGSTKVGKIVAAACAEHLTPCTLELGGKSPCIIDQTTNLSKTAKRIVWGKFWNAGQTCVAPDYLLVHVDVKTKLVQELKKQILNFFGSNPEESKDFARIINHSHYDRLVNLIAGGAAIHGGKRNRETLYIEPTLIEGVDLEHPSMKDEIFGPILPILEWKEKAELYAAIKKNSNPLALYIFSNDRKFTDEFIRSVPFGGGCVNHTLLHLSNPNLPFGGIRQSGIGSYHGKTGFDTFTHFKSMFYAGPFDIALKYPPYKDWKYKIAKFWNR